MNTTLTLADAVIRVFTGQFSDPDLEGFFPSVSKIPTRRALELTLALGNALGLEEEIGQNPYGFTHSNPKRAYTQAAQSAKLEAPDVQDWDKEIGFGAGRGYSWNGPHFMGLGRLGG